MSKAISDTGIVIKNNEKKVINEEFPPHIMENNFMLYVEPNFNNKIYFKGPMNQELTSYLILTNRDDYKQAFKVKCSKNETFKIKPSFGVLQHGEKIKITLTYIPTENFENEVNRHHFGIFHIPCSEGAHPLAIWETHYGPPQGSLRLKIEFQDNDNK